MSTSYDLDAKQTQLVRDLMEAVDAALDVNILVPLDFAAAREALNEKCAELRELFPHLNKIAEEFWFSDSPFAPEWIEEAQDSTSVTFDAILCTYSVENSATLSQYTHALENLRNELGDLATWSSQWDVDRGTWK